MGHLVAGPHLTKNMYVGECTGASPGTTYGCKIFFAALARFFAVTATFVNFSPF